MSHWWDRYPEQFEAERAGLDSLGHPWSIDASAKQAGLLVIHIDIPYESEKLHLVATYPTSYPYFPPVVTLPDKILPRHQQPVAKNLCLLARDGEEWRPGQDTLALLLEKQLPQLLQVNSSKATPDFVAENEDHVGEPFASFLVYPPHCAIIVPDETPSATSEYGTLELKLRPEPPGWNNKFMFVNGAVVAIGDSSAKPLIECVAVIPAFSENKKGYWARLEKRPDMAEAGDQGHFVQYMIGKVPEFSKSLQSAPKGKIFILGFVYADEVSWRSCADDWFFMAVRIDIPAKRSRQAVYTMQFIRADWGGEEAWLRRAPMLSVSFASTATLAIILR